MKYVIGVLVILALLFLLWWLFSRNKQRKLDEQRAQAATIRAEAEQRGGVLRGQENFAQQADERASTARQKAEERARQAELSAREAQRAEEEARQHRDELERSRRAHEAELRRADELDPDVEVAKDDPRPLPEDLDDDVRPLDETRTHRPVPAALSDNASRTGGAPGTQTDPELSHGSERDRSDSSDDGSSGRGAAVTAAGAAAVGSAYAATRGNVTDEEAASRLASGADFSDDTHHVEDVEHPASRSESGGSAEWDNDMDESTTDTGRASSDDEGTRDDMTQDDMTQDDMTRDDVRSDDDTSAHDETPSSDERHTRGAASDGEAVMITDVEDYASTEPLPAESGRADESDSLDRSADEARGATDGGFRDDLGREGAASDDDRFVNDERTTAGATTGAELTDAGRADADDRGTHDTVSDGRAANGGASNGEAVMINDVEDYASTEPLPAESTGMGASASNDWSDDDGRAATYEGSRDDAAQEDVTSRQDASRTGAHEVARTDEAVAEDGRGGESTFEDDRREEPATDDTWEDDQESAPTSVAGGTAAAGADAGDADRAGDETLEDRGDDETRGDRGDATHWPDGTDRINPVDSDSDSDSREQPREGGWSRRISGIDEIRDGGYGVGSAAPLEDRGQPADHPIQAYRDSNTFRVPGSEGYDSAEPDVWFYDEESARRAGFKPSES